MSAVSQTPDLWDEAFSRIAKDTKQWKRFCKIVADNEIPGFAMSNVASSSSSSSSVRALNPESLSAKDMSPIVQNLRSIVERDDAKPVRHFCSKAIDMLSNVKDAASALAGLNPYAAAGWGVVAFLVTGAKRHAIVKEFCWKRIPVLASIVYRYQTYLDVYLDDDALQTSNAQLRATMIELFIQIFQFQIACVIAVKSRTERLKMFITDNDTTQLSENLDTQENLLKDLQAVVNRQTDKIRFHDLLQTTQCLQHSVDSRLGLLDAQLSSIKAQISLGERDAVLTWISTTEYERVHAKPTKTPIGVTGDWLLEDVRYSAWADAQGDAILWLFGKMGSGKSCVTHAVIDSLKQRVENVSGDLLAFFYCDSTDPEGKDDMSSVENILRILLKQLADSDGEDLLDTRLIELYRRQKHKGRLTAEQCVYWMSQMAVGKRLTIIIDGLDESSVDVQRKLINHINSLSDQTDLPLKLYIASRSRTVIRTGLKTVHVSSYDAIDIALHNRDPLNAMIDAKIEEALAGSLRWLYIDEDQNLDQSKAVAIALKETADGMFQWVASALSWLHESEDYFMLSDRLRMLAHLEELDDLYKELYNSNLRMAVKGRNEITMKTIILFVLYGGTKYRNWTEPDIIDGSLGLYLDGADHYDVTKLGGPDLHIRQACSYIQTGNCQRAYSVNDLCNFCPGLLCVDEDAGTLSFPHASVREFFIDNQDYPEYTHRDGNAYLAALCMNVFIDFERGFRHLESTAVGQGFLWHNTIVLYASQFWYHHILEFTSTNEAASQVLDGLGANDQRLGNKFGFKAALNSFILRDPAPKPFIKWHEWMQEYRNDLASRCYGESDGFLTKPPSTILIRSALGLDTNYLQFEQRKLLNVSSVKLSYDQRSDYLGSTTAFAIRTNNLSLFKALMEHGCLQLDNELIEKVVNAGCDIAELPGDLNGFVPLEALKEIAIRAPSILECTVDEATLDPYRTKVSPAIYLLERGLHPSLLPHMLSVFLNCGLSPAYEEEYAGYSARYIVHNNWTQQGEQRSLSWHIAKTTHKNFLVAPEAEVSTNPLLLQFASSAKDLRKILMQAAQAGNVELMSTIIRRHADLAFESEHELTDLYLHSLNQAVAEGSDFTDWFYFKIARNFDNWEAYLRRYTRTISILTQQLMIQDPQSFSQALHESLTDHESESLLKVAALCCDVEVLSFWIEQTRYQQASIKELVENDQHSGGQALSNCDNDSESTTGSPDVPTSWTIREDDTSSLQNQLIGSSKTADTEQEDDVADNTSPLGSASPVRSVSEDYDARHGLVVPIHDKIETSMTNRSFDADEEVPAMQDDTGSVRKSESHQSFTSSDEQEDGDTDDHTSSNADEDRWVRSRDLFLKTQRAVTDIETAIKAVWRMNGIFDLSDDERSATIEGLKWYKYLIMKNIEYLRSIAQPEETTEESLSH